MYEPLAREHKRAQEVKAKSPILVCIGNPPYNRDRSQKPDDSRRGGWVRHGEDGKRALLQDFVEPAQRYGKSQALQTIFNDYVYFWRWALWKVFEGANSDFGIVSFITASSYLRGDGFVGMREHIRHLLDELWIIDLEGDQSGTRITDNIFSIRVPVAIAVAVRDGSSDASTPARVWYSRVSGSEVEKLASLGGLKSFSDLKWLECLSGWPDPFLPRSTSAFFDWPKIEDIFPWKDNGIQMYRTWPIGVTKDVLRKRWQVLVRANEPLRRKLFKESRDRKISSNPPHLEGHVSRPGSIRSLEDTAPCPPISSFAWRSFDRQWVLADSRVGDYMRPNLWRSHGEGQIYLVSLLNGVLGKGPAAMVSSDPTDMHFFRGSYGTRGLIPLWRDRNCTQPNMSDSLVSVFEKLWQQPVVAPDVFSYCYAVLFTPTFVERFWEELSIPGVRVPMTKSRSLFLRGVQLGRRLVFLHTHGNRFVPVGDSLAQFPQGLARCTKAISEDPDRYPRSFEFDADGRTLTVGEGEIAPVSSEVWEFSISGFYPVRSWLAYRMESGAGMKSSPLDAIRPERWTAEMTEDLLRILWVLEATIEMLPDLEANLDQILEGEVFTAVELPRPSAEERKPPEVEKPTNVQDEIQF